MSNFTANSVYPILSALPIEEREKALRFLQKITPTEKTPKKKKTRTTIDDKVAAVLGD